MPAPERYSPCKVSLQAHTCASDLVVCAVLSAFGMSQADAQLFSAGDSGRYSRRAPPKNFLALRLPLPANSGCLAHEVRVADYFRGTFRR